ncbi:MAG: DUF503 domain-containing protein [Deltaproteobacteria bacterium]|nr:DUF503 domain-containing protein [Deltaproteobacteria bacterium]
MFVGIVKLSVYLPNGHSLKEKRRILNIIRDRVRNKMNIIIAEVGDQDLWQRAELGFAVVSNDSSFVDSVVTKTTEIIENIIPGHVIDRKYEIVTF